MPVSLLLGLGPRRGGGGCARCAGAFSSMGARLVTTEAPCLYSGDVATGFFGSISIGSYPQSTENSVLLSGDNDLDMVRRIVGLAVRGAGDSEREGELDPFLTLFSLASDAMLLDSTEERPLLPS